MDAETKIAQDLASKLPQPQPIPSGYPEPEPVEQPEFVDKMLPEDQTLIRDVLDYLQHPQLSRHDPMVQDYSRTVYEWAREVAGSSDINQILRVINEQEMHLGSKLKPDRLRRLAEYVKINRLRQSLAAKERALYE